MKQAATRLLARLAGTGAAQVQIEELPWVSALGAYRTLPHRLSLVASVAGVAFYDDSKATNVGAAVEPCAPPELCEAEECCGTSALCGAPESGVLESRGTAFVDAESLIRTARSG